MIKKVFFILTFLLGIVFHSIVNSYFCDGFIEGSLCDSGSIIEDIDSIDNFSSSYNDINLGYFGNKNTTIIHGELETNLGYFGNKYSYNPGIEMWSTLGFLGTKRIVLSPDYQMPVGLFGFYKNQNLTFIDKKEENNFSAYPLIRFISEKTNNSLISGSSQSCSSPNNVINTKIDINNNGLSDYVHISWDNPGKEKVKVIKIGSDKKEFQVINGNNYYDDFGLDLGNNSYFIVVYNDCFTIGFYSDLLNIYYGGKKLESSLYLSLSNNELSLNIPKNIDITNTTKINLKCNDFSGVLVNDYLINKRYSLSQDLLKKYFTCEASFFDSKGVFQKSELFVNNILKDNLIREKEALDYIYVGDSSNYLFNSLYLNVSKYDSGAYLTYGKSSLYLVNILTKTYVSSEDFSFDALKNLGYLGSNISINDKITEQDFIKLLLFIEKDIAKFQENTTKYVNDNYGNKKYSLVSNDILENLFLIKKLKSFKNTDNQKYNNLLECISRVRCKDFSLLNGISVEGLKQEIDINTYKDYMKLLYFNLGYDSFKQYFYSLDDYNKFIDILVESVSNGNDFYDTKITYESFRNLQYEILLHEKLQENISYLEKYLTKILVIYETTSKEDLIWILRDFLGK